MSSLAGTTEKLRSLLKIGGIGAGILFGLYLLIMGGIFMKNIFFPAAPEAPNQEFGQLPELVFESKASSAIDYKINTVTGELPTNLPRRMLVYKLEQVKPDLLALQNARSIASAAGFNNNELKLSDSMYQWTNPNTNAVLKFDINNKTFEINSDLGSIQSILVNAVIPEEERIKQYAGDFLSSLRVNKDKLTYKENSFIYYSLVNGILTEVENSFNSKLVRISLYNDDIENDIGKFPFVYGNQAHPLVTLLVAFPSSARMVVVGGESYNKIITDESSDYQIKSPQQAFSDLQQGSGYLFNPENLNTIEITDIYLAYYLDKNIFDYAQPVYVFEGISSKAFVEAAQFATVSAEVSSE